MQILINIAAFIVTVGVLIVAHEYGHFWVARKLGVKVLRFSVGFGKPIWRKQIGDTEYVVSVLPLGGYIKMLDEREGSVAVEERHRAFNLQPVWKRIAIVAAGPVFNFILAFAVYIAVFLIGIPGVKPLVQPDAAAAAAGFVAQDEIVAVNNEPTHTWQEVRMAVLQAAMGQDVTIFSVKTAAGEHVQRHLSLPGESVLQSQQDFLERIGLRMWWPKTEPIIAEVQADSPAQRGGMQPGDRVLRIGEDAIDDWGQLAKIVQAHAGQSLEFLVLRDGQEQQLHITPQRQLQGGASLVMIGASAQTPQAALQAMRVIVRHELFAAIARAFTETGKMISLTFKMLGKLVIGEASLKNISGPLTIAEYAGKSVSIDFSYYLNFLAIISISLGVLNLLPVPLLDGGHLLYYAIEAVKGSPPSEHFQYWGQQLGFVILACLMGLALYNDLLRLFG